MFIALSLFVALVGAALYFLTGPKLAELGRLAFTCGLLAFLLRAAGEGFRLGS